MLQLKPSTDLYVLISSAAGVASRSCHKFGNIYTHTLDAFLSQDPRFFAGRRTVLIVAHHTLSDFLSRDYKFCLSSPVPWPAPQRGNIKIMAAVLHVVVKKLLPFVLLMLLRRRKRRRSIKI